MDKVKTGIIGIGNMGSSHAKAIIGGAIPQLELTAVADESPERRQWAAENLGGVTVYAGADELIAGRLCDAVIIASPHYQ
ncbi:MAG: Gfo/Idh/MocA family oxidoreductase, partial [Treponema sp.]|nr:Gfo/Idh/MocA family oxidoreductase [Treponema sp.]